MAFPAKAQLNFPDTVHICDTNLVQINMDLDSATIALLNEIQTTSFTSLSLGDDEFSDDINLDFTFNFYGFSYTSCILSSNNFISFDTSYALHSSPYTIASALPDAATNTNASKLKNTILAPWQDIQPNTGGMLDYATIGTAPNRIFVVRWFDVPMYNCSNLYYSSAILLYENGDKIETHIVNKPNCSWNSGLAIHGLQNKTGTTAEIIIDPTTGLERNVPNTWSTDTEGVRFVPNGNNDYTTSFVDFIPIVSVSNLLWSTTDSTLVGIGSSFNWDPASSTGDLDTLIVNSPSFNSTFTDTIVLISNPNLNISLPNGSPCNFDSVLLAHNLPYADSVLWSTGETSPTIQIFTNGLYSVTAYLDDCSYTKSLSILFNQSDFSLGNDTLLCAGDSLMAGASFIGANYFWQDGFNEPIYNIKEPGTYWVTMTLNGCQYKDTIEVDFTAPFVFPSDTLVCAGTPFDLEANYPNSTFVWQDGSTDSIFNVSQNGVYSVTVTTPLCTFFAETAVLFIDSLIFDLGPDTAICFGDTLFLGTNYTSANYLWQDGSTPVKYNVEETGLYHCEITVGNCTISDTIFVTVDSIIEVDLGGQLTICEGDTLILDAFNDGATYTWNDSSIDTTLAVTGAGIYFVEVERNGCFFSDTVLVTKVAQEDFDFENDTVLICNGSTWAVDVSHDLAIGYIWQDGTISSGYFITQPGTYSFEIFFDNCSYTDSVVVDTISSAVIDLGPDITICHGDTAWLDATFPTASYDWTFTDDNGSTQNGTDAIYGAHTSGFYEVVLSYNNCTFVDTINVIVKPISSFDLGPDQSICANDNLVIGGFTPGATYLWNNGSTLSYQNVNQTGMYTLEVTLDGCPTSDSIFVDVVPIPNFSLGPDTILCTGETLLLDAYYPGATYTWQDGQTLSTYLVDKSGLYSAVLELDGCTFKDQINVKVIDSIMIDLPDTISFCEGESYYLNATFPDSGTTYTWNDGDHNAIHEVSTGGYSHVILQLGNCQFSDSTFVVVRPLPTINLIDTNICFGDQVVYSAYNQDAMSYMWQNGSTSSSIIAEQEGWYHVTVQNQYCVNQDSAYLSLTYVPETVLPEDTFLCEGNALLFHYTDTNYVYQWQNGTFQNQFSISDVGIYSLNVSNKCGESFSTMTVTREDCLCTLFIPNSFSPNGDNNNDNFEIFPECALSSYELQIFNRWGKMVFATEDPSEFWDGTFQGDELLQDSYVYKIKYAFVGEQIVHRKTNPVILLK